MNEFKIGDIVVQETNSGVIKATISNIYPNSVTIVWFDYTHKLCRSGVKTEDLITFKDYELKLIRDNRDKKLVEILK